MIKNNFFSLQERTTLKYDCLKVALKHLSADGYQKDAEEAIKYAKKLYQFVVADDKL
jgi:hypothetical protein